MHRLGVSRRTLVVGLGGGVICDLAALAAATYMRGLPYLLIPSSLVALADAAIGGKGGADFVGTKNLIGAFCHPAAVVVDPGLLATLEDHHVRNGMAEIIKVAAISDEDLFRLVEAAALTASGRPRDLAAVIRGAIGGKLRLLGPDPFERGSLARVLNFGHCVGHPLEAASGFRIPHGAAVAAGMAVATAASGIAGRCSPATAGRILDVLARYRLPATIPMALRAATWEGVADVRRIRNGVLNFVVPRQVGQGTFLEEMSRSLYDSALERLDTGQRNGSSRLSGACP
jgi:3-dehydroquinate synthetase